MQDIEKEKESIKADAIKNGTWMKAPNGKVSNLSEEQWLIVRTKNFKEWFGDWEFDAEITSLYDNNNNLDHEKLKNVVNRLQQEHERNNGICKSISGKIHCRDGRNVEASVITAAKRRATGPYKERNRTWAEHKKIVAEQEQALEDYAKEVGIWFDDYSIFEREYGIFDAGMESEVYYDKHSSAHLIKTFGYDFVKKIDPYTAIKERIELHNQYFPSTAYEIIGYTRDKRGFFKFVLKQLFVVGDILNTIEKIEFFTTNYKAIPINDQATSFKNNIHTISDLHEGNLYKTRESIQVFDPQISVNEDILIDDTDVSRAVDENGEPLVIFHGSTKDFDSFYESKLKNEDSLIYSKGYNFSKNSNFENHITNDDDFDEYKKKETIAVFFNIRNNEDIQDVYFISNCQE